MLGAASQVSTLGAKSTKKARQPGLILLLGTTLVVISAVMVCQVVVTIGRNIGTYPDDIVSSPSAIGSLLGWSVDDEVGDMVFLNDVRLEAGLKPHVFVVSGFKGVRMLVVSGDEALPPEQRPVTVDIKGRIRQMPSLAFLQKKWKLSKDQIRIFGRQKIYIAAEYVKEQDQNAKAD